MSEQIILRGKPSIVPIVGEWIVITIAFIIAALVIMPFFKSFSAMQNLWLALVGFLILGQTARNLFELIEAHFSSLTLTRTQVIRERGLINHDYDKIPIHAIQTTRIRYALLGRILGYGTLQMGTPSGPITVRHLSSPQKWIDCIDQLQRIPAPRR